MFGFSSYEFAQLLGHLNLVMTFLIPVMVHITLRRADREISRRAYVLNMAFLFVLQLGLSSELLADCIMLGAVALVAARFLAALPQRERMDGLIVQTLIAGLIAIAVTSPFLYYAFIPSGAPPANPTLANLYPLDLPNLIFPTATTWLGHHYFYALSSKYDTGDTSESDGYLSIAILSAFASWFCTAGWRSLLGKLLAIVIALSLTMALGTNLHFAGHGIVPMPWKLVSHWPIFDNIAPTRIVLFAGLAMSIGVAAWLARRDGHTLGRWLLVLLGVVMIFPNVNSSFYGGVLTNPSFFSTSTYRRYLARNETVLLLPFGYHDLSTLWQAETGFYFHMPEGYVSAAIPAAFQTQLAMVGLINNVATAPASLALFIRRHHVRHVVVDPTMAGPWPRVLAKLGLHGQEVGGVLLYGVRAAPA